MVISHSHKAALLSRVLSLKDKSPFILVVDSIAQSADLLVTQLFDLMPKSTNVIALSYEGSEQYHMVKNVIDCTKGTVDIAQKLSRYIDASVPNLVVIDSLNFIPTQNLSHFLVSIMRTGCVVFGVFHNLVHSADRPNSSHSDGLYPSQLMLLSYLATTTLTVQPIEPLDEEENNALESTLYVPLGCNREKFIIDLVHSRKSGRAIEASYVVDVNKSEIEYVVKSASYQQQEEDNEKLLAGLTSFNLSMTEKQKQDKENVELPYFQAQQMDQGGTQGGAIIYHFEKDDDYDEEDPYEDPF